MLQANGMSLCVHTNCFNCLVDLTRSSSSYSTQLSASACKALGHIFSSGPLPIPTGTVRSGKEKMEEGEEGVTKAMLMECLAELMKNAKQPKVRTAIYPSFPL